MLEFSKKCFETGVDQKMTYLEVTRSEMYTIQDFSSHT